MGEAMGADSICPDRRLWRLARLTSPSGRTAPTNSERTSNNSVIRVFPENAGEPEQAPPNLEVGRRGLPGGTIGSVSSLARIVIPARRRAAGYRPRPAFRNNERNLQVP